MDIEELGRLDLNLLVALEALLEERNVSKAAERLFVTQSAMSKTLGRLRDLFDDPLFVRQASGMVPTPRAEQLARSLPDVLQAVQAMIQPEHFDPLAYEGEFKLLVQGHMGVWFLPALVERLRQSAPNIRLEAASRAENDMDELARGGLDFILQVERNEYPPNVILTTLGFASPALLVRRGHPLEGGEITLELLKQYPQVILLGTDIEQIQFVTGDKHQILEFERQVQPQLSTDDLYVAQQVVRNSDYVFPAPPMFLEQFDMAGKLVPLQIPGPEKISVKYVVVRHERTAGSAPYDFLYSEIVATAEEFRQRFGLPNLEQLRQQRELAY